MCKNLAIVSDLAAVGTSFRVLILSEKKSGLKEPSKFKKKTSIFAEKKTYLFVVRKAIKMVLG